MRYLNLDYRDNKVVLHYIGMLLLAIVLILTVTAALYFNQVRQQTVLVAQMVDRLEYKINGHVTASKISQIPPVKLAEIIKFSNHVIHQLNLPWSELLAELEAAKNNGVALLAITPNAKNGMIKIDGEAKNYATMLKYVRDLSAQSVLQGVYLTEHKMDAQNPDKPILFSLEVSWAAK